MLYKKTRLTIATIVYWLLLAYIVSALVFWFIELQNQNLQTTNYRMQELKHDDPDYFNRADHILIEKRNKTAQYIGEGLTFLSVIAIGAIFLYRAVMRQIRIQQQQQNFMMAVTHELKTPIAVAKLNLETLQKHKLDTGRQEKMIQSALQEINRLDNLANNILVSAQLEGGHYNIAKDDIDFSLLTLAAANDYSNRVTDRKWEIDIQPGLHIIGDALLLKILINNLIENAIKYSPANGPIAINTKKENSHIILQVKDGGPGIPAGERKKIFRKFYRIGNEETRTAKGTGLGLYLCKKIASDHKAQITVSANKPAGSNFTVVF